MAQDSRRAALGTIHMQWNCVTKTRLVWCIHILAYVFSLLVLAVSAFSHSCGFYLTSSCKTGGDTSDVYVCSGQFFLVRQYGFPFPKESEYGFFDLDDWTAVERDLLSQTKDFHFQCLTRYSGIGSTTYFGMLQSFLVLPMTWLSGFYLFKLRRHFRKRSASFQSNVPCVRSE